MNLAKFITTVIGSSIYTSLIWASIVFRDRVWNWNDAQTPYPVIGFVLILATFLLIFSFIGFISNNWNK